MCKVISVRHIFLILISFALTACSGCARNGWHKEQGIIWTTQYHITYNGPSGLQDTVLSVLNSVDASLSAFNPNSLVSAINQDSLGGSVDNLLEKVFFKSLEINEKSGGMFDPTVSPLINLWGFGFDGHSQREPSSAQIDSALTLVGIARCSISNHNLVKGSPGMQFNFSAIAKGYASDLVADALQSAGATACMVEIGGEIVVRGNSPRGGKWRVSIDAPIAETPTTHTSMRVVEISSPCGIATSGNYRNFRQSAEGVVGHTISPLTGRPVQTDVLSATVIAPTCLEADALATACMAMPSADALQMIAGLSGVEALLVVSGDASQPWTVITTPGFP